jgi:hypothetical protein
VTHPIFVTFEPREVAAAALPAGIDFRLVRVWPGADRRFERKLHNRHGSRPCPEPACVSAQLQRRLQLRLALTTG